MNSQVPSEMVSTTGIMGTLIFNPLSASHAGTYTCRAEVGGEILTDTLMLIVESELLIMSLVSLYHNNYGISSNSVDIYL